MSSNTVKKILILAANPKSTPRLHLDEEVREIQAGLERSKRREQFDITVKWAVRPDDLRRAMLDYEPQIVHFSGHGSKIQGLALEDNSAQTQFVSAEALARLFGLFAGKVECVLLNACYSDIQAEAINQHVDYVVGMSQAILDQAAVKFAVGFYDALGAGRSFEDAYQFGCSAIDLDGIPQNSIPVFRKRTKVEPVPFEKMVTSDQEQEQKKSIDRLPSLSVALENLGGQVPLDSPLYVERPPIESDCYETIMQPGALIRVKAPRQMGKTSLMTRILHHAEQQGYQAVSLNFQEADGEVFSHLEKFLQWFCSSITNELELPDKLTDHWQGVVGSKSKCTNYLQRYLLSEITSQLALGLDEVDQVFQHPQIATDFFGLLRTWHEKGKNQAVWKKLRLVIVHSKEVYIPLNFNQSPFNVGLPIELPQLNQAQVQELAQRHGLDWVGEHVEQLMAMVGGHPYLVRVALYQIASGRMTLAKLLQVAPTEEGPYCDHLRRHLLSLEENADLVAAIKKVIVANSLVEIKTAEAFRLRSMGLVKFQGNAIMPLCELYKQYFRSRLSS